MRKPFSNKKILGLVTLGVTGILIVASVLTLLGGGAWWHINNLNKDKKALTEKVGELNGKVETLEKANLDLTRQIDFQSQLTRESMAVSSAHAQEQEEAREKATGFKEVLTQKTVVITKTEPISAEQQRNSQARIGTLWASYCDATKDTKRCVDKHIPSRKGPKGQALTSLDWIFVPYADQLSGWILQEGEPVGLNSIHQEVKESNHA